MHKQIIMAASIAIAVAGASPAWAGWGCAYNSNAGIGRTWGLGSEKDARKKTLDNCTVRNFKQCRIIGCSANVNSKADADKLWSRTPGVKYDCGEPGEPRC